MSAYAVATIRETRFNDEVAEYLRRIDDTLAPFSGRYLIHGGPYLTLEGSWSGDLVVIVFPSMEQAQAWYHSDAYGAIRKLRPANNEDASMLSPGVEARTKLG